jgi:RNA polymerase sigma-70 factor, ECF subfamily
MAGAAGRPAGMDDSAVNIRGAVGSKWERVFASRQTLVARCEVGDRQAWRELHQRYQPIVASFLRHMGVSPDEIEDASQEVFVQVFRYLARFEERADLKTWIYKLCITQAGRLRRRARVAAALDWVLGARTPAPTGGGLDWSDAEAHRRLAAALDQMKPIHRHVFVLYELEGLSGEEVAAAAGLPSSTVRRRLHHARQEFEAALQGLGEGES